MPTVVSARIDRRWAVGRVGRYLARRFLSTVIIFIVSCSLVFLALLYGGGDPTDILLHESGTEVMKQQLRANLGLLDPAPVQWWRFVKGMLLKGDLGTSWQSGRPVLTEIADVFPNTLVLTLASALVACLIGIPAGILSAYKQGTSIDGAIQVLAVAGISIPSFVTALLLLLVFAYRLGWFPVFGVGTWKHLVLPAATTGVYLATGLARMTRSCMLEVLSQDYIVTGRAKGLSEFRVVISHGLRNALVPLMTVLGLQFGLLMGGTVVTETVFAWPGVGRLMVGSILSRDFPLVRGAGIVFLACFVIVNLAVDLAYLVVDPRIRFSG